MLIEVRNEAETILQATEKTFRRPDFDEIAAARLSPDEIASIRSALADLASAVSTSDRHLLQAKSRALNDGTRHLAEVMMNWTIQAALAGRAADEVAAKGR
jgi:molecular chaperone DnaK (HSP70)